MNEVSGLSFIRNVDGDIENKVNEATNAKNNFSQERNDRDELRNSKDNILEIFKELRLGMQELVLTDEQLKCDDQLQEDEVFFRIDNS